MQASDDVSINTLVGPGSTIRGELTVAGFVRVDGDIDGDLETTGRVIVGDKPGVQSVYQNKEIQKGSSRDVLIRNGLQQAALESGALGSVITRKLQVEPEVILHGSCFAVDDEDRYNAALAGYNNRQAMRHSSRAASGVV